MGGQGCFKHAREMKVGGGWTKITRGVRRQRGQVCDFWIASIVDRI
jgi:hypothetical protein